jgi:cytochrome o ubiquinol oxidase subunit III
MSDTAIAYAGSDPQQLGSITGAAAHSGPASRRIVTGYGFWIFILSDMVMFSAFFATYAVLLGQTAGGPGGRDLFDLRNVAVETAFLLASSFTCGLASIAAETRNATWFQLAMAVTCIFGLGFLAIEINEFATLVARGAGPTRSAFLSAFFTLVGCHGLHVPIYSAASCASRCSGTRSTSSGSRYSPSST